MKKLLITFLLTTVINGYTQEDGIRATNVLIPEAYTFKFNSAGSVDYHGDFSASIPLMTVPGRGGMDYGINLSYKSGITTDQRATWVGLGWNLNPGTITRIVNGVPDNINGTMVHQPYTENGAIVNYDETAEYGGWLFPNPDNLDYFLVNIPGVVSGLLVPVALNSDSVPDYAFQEYNGWRVAMDLQPVGTTFGGGTTFQRAHVPALYSPGRDYRDVGFIYLIDPNGVWYIFGLPLRSEMVWYNPAPYRDPRFVIEYVSTWMLTSILSPDYSMANYNNGDLLPTENDGTWIKFEYNYPYSGTNERVRNIRPLYFDRATSALTNKDPYGLLNQTTYLSKIITPTHEAVFETTPRDDISFLSPQSTNQPYKTGVIGDYTISAQGNQGTFIKPLRLDRIKLFRRSPSTQISVVEMDYASQGQELCRYGYSLSVPTGTGDISLNGIGKTTLKEVRIGDGTTGHAYRFQYTDEIDGFNPYYIVSPGDHGGMYSVIQAIETYSTGYDIESFQGRSYFRSRSGRAGLLFARASELTSFSPTISGTKGAAAWSLRTIEYPTGAVDTIAYELDVFDKSIDSSNSTYAVRPMWMNFAPDEAGIRASSISSFDPITGNFRKTRYEYAGGRLPGLPLSYLRNFNQYVGNHLCRLFLSGYNSADVEYQKITTVLSDGVRQVTRYSSVADSSGKYDEQEANASHLLLKDNGHSRGKILSVENYDADNALTTRSASSYETSLKYSGYQTITLFPPSVTYSYFVGGKRLLESWAVLKTVDSTYRYELDVAGTARLPQIGRTTYAYNSFLQLKYESIYFSQTRFSQTSYNYVHESADPLAGTFLAKNRLNALFDKTITERNGGTSWIKQYSSYAWSTFGTQPRIQSIMDWKDANRDGIRQTDEYVPVSTVNSYDSYGNPLSVTDVHGVTTNYEWSSVYQGSRLTRRTTLVEGTSLVRSYSYDAHYLIDTETDENNQTRRFIYDALGRLTKILGPQSEVLKVFEYNFRNPTAMGDN